MPCLAILHRLQYYTILVICFAACLVSSLLFDKHHLYLPTIFAKLALKIV